MVVEFQQIQGISELEGCESSSLESPKDLMGNKKRKKSPLRKKKKKRNSQSFWKELEMSGMGIWKDERFSKESFLHPFRYSFSV